MSEAAAERWRETCQWFHELSDLDDAARRTRLSEIGRTDPELRLAVESLLAADDLADERLKPLTVGISDVLHRNLAPARAPVVDPLRLVGRTISHFRIIEPIAAGGMGVVYRAEDTRPRAVPERGARRRRARSSEPVQHLRGRRERRRVVVPRHAALRR